MLLFKGMPRRLDAKAKRGLAWLVLALLAVLCGVIAALQFRWIDEISHAERERLQQELQTKLNLLSRSFNERISTDLSDLSPAQWQLDQLGEQQAYVARFRGAKERDSMFSRFGVALPRDGSLALFLWNARAGNL